MSDAVDRLVATVEALRTHCPWTRSLTHGDLTEYLVEEAYEAVEEIGARTDAQWADTAARRADGAYAALAGELGDVLFQVVLHAAVSRHPDAPASEAGFRLADAAEALTAKMVRRNPLVFTPDGRVRPAEDLAGITPADVELAWERAKQQERAAAGAPHGDAVPASAAEAPDAGFGGIPARLPALAAAAAGLVARAGVRLRLRGSLVGREEQRRERRGRSGPTPTVARLLRPHLAGDDRDLGQRRAVPTARPASPGPCGLVRRALHGLRPGPRAGLFR